MSSSKGAARAAQQSTPFRILARSGFAANGVLHVLIGVLALSVAFGAGGEADQGGALGAVASAPAGALLLWVMGIGLVALALWSITQAFLATGSDDKERWAERAKEAGKGIAYAAVAVTAIRFATGGSSGGDQQAQSFSTTLLGNPFGVVLLMLVALGIVAVGGYFVYKGAKKKFLDDISEPARLRRPITALGMAGYIAKGAALIVVGILFAIASVTTDASEAAGLDGALKTLAGLPFGPVLLTLVGLGFIAYGIYSGVRARYARL